MSVGTDLLELQEIDLSLTRVRGELSDLPELKDLARKRKTHQKLKDDVLKLVGRRKDIETALEELAEDETACRQELDDIQNEGVDPSNYDHVQELEIRLTDIAKELDKIEYARTEHLRELKDAQAKEAYANEYIQKFEKSLLADAQATRDKATSLKQEVERLEHQRAAYVARIPEADLARYEDAAKRFGGLAVERLEGTVPSICRMSLTESSMFDLSRAGELTECPYCHRILVNAQEL